MPRGRFITLEGGEGAGKSTQAALLADALGKLGIAVEQTREPGGTPFAEAIRSVLVGDCAQGIDPVAEALAHFAARADHVARRIRPALDQGHWVISDRFADSTMVYQGIAGRAGRARVRAIARAALGDFAPDLTLVLDVPAELGLRRARDANRYEALGLPFHEAVRAGFRSVARTAARRCALIDASGGIAEVQGRIAAAVRDRLGVAL